MDYREYPPQLWNQDQGGLVPVPYQGYPPPHHAQFTSPPATPMTPALQHQFPLHQHYELPPHSLPFPSHPPPPCPPAADYRLYTLCQQLQTYCKVSEVNTDSWWMEFMKEFFDDHSNLIIEVDIGEGNKKYHLNRAWIPLYFLSLLNNGVTSIHLDLGQCVSTYHQQMQELECRSVTMETHHTSPHPAKVCTTGSLLVDFNLDEKPRIINWYFHIKDHTEYIPRTIIGQLGIDSGLQENITVKGLLPATQKLLQEGARADGPSYHHVPVPMANVTPLTNGLHHHNTWQQEVPNLISMHPGIDVIHHPGQLQVEAAASGLSARGLMQTLSPGTPLPSMMPVTPPSSSSPCLLPPGTSGGNGGGKIKASRSNSRGGSRKRQSPICSGAGITSKRPQQECVLVAGEPMPLTEADDLPFVFDERMIQRIDSHNNTNDSPSNNPDTPNLTSATITPTPSSSSSSKPSPSTLQPNTIGLITPTNSDIANGTSLDALSIPGTTKLCHLADPTPSSSQVLSHSTTISSSMQAIDAESQGQIGLPLAPHTHHMYTPMQQWADQLVLMKHGVLTTTQ